MFHLDKAEVLAEFRLDVSSSRKPTWDLSFTSKRESAFSGDLVSSSVFQDFFTIQAAGFSLTLDVVCFNSHAGRQSQRVCGSMGRAELNACEQTRVCVRV